MDEVEELEVALAISRSLFDISLRVPSARRRAGARGEPQSCDDGECGAYCATLLETAVFLALAQCCCR
jgi:hypothetical protein